MRNSIATASALLVTATLITTASAVCAQSTADHRESMRVNAAPHAFMPDSDMASYSIGVQLANKTEAHPQQDLGFLGGLAIGAFAPYAYFDDTHRAFWIAGTLAG